MAIKLEIFETLFNAQTQIEKTSPLDFKFEPHQTLLSHEKLVHITQGDCVVLSSECLLSDYQTDEDYEVTKVPLIQKITGANLALGRILIAVCVEQRESSTAFRVCKQVSESLLKR